APQPAPMDMKLAPAPLVIEVDDRAKDARLQIPSALFRFRAELDGEEKDGQRADAGTLPPGRTVMVGLAMALALSCGGLWLVRSRRLTDSRVVLPLVALAFVTLTGALVWANAAPLRPVPAPKMDAKDKVTVEITSKDGAPVKLIISSERLVK